MFSFLPGNGAPYFRSQLEHQPPAAGTSAGLRQNHPKKRDTQ
jgi:hypothetical protein